MLTAIAVLEGGHPPLMEPIILASQSPRRRELLALYGVPFEVDPTYNRIGTVTISDQGRFELRLRSEYRYDWNTDDVKFQYVADGVVYEKVFGSLSALNSSSGPIILEQVKSE